MSDIYETIETPLDANDENVAPKIHYREFRLPDDEEAFFALLLPRGGMSKGLRRMCLPRKEEALLEIHVGPPIGVSHLDTKRFPAEQRRIRIRIRGGAEFRWPEAIGGLLQITNGVITGGLLMDARPVGQVIQLREGLSSPGTPIKMPKRPPSGPEAA